MEKKKTKAEQVKKQPVQKTPAPLEDAEALDELEELGVETGDSEARPLVVCDENGGFLFFSMANRKCYTKSIEQGALWLTHPDTDRILPSGKEARLKQFQDRDDYYYAEVFVGGAMTVPAPSSAGEPLPAGSSPGGILADLAALIARRRQEMPEGSYTAYLFQEGVEKIRKKTGEEAIELVLARTPHDIVYEAADLLYHMLVLLEAEGIAFADVLEELKTRK